MFIDPAQSAGEKKPIEMVDHVAVVSLPVRGFEKLSTKDKILAYHLYNSAIAGREINFEQNYRYNLPIRRICEGILFFHKGIDEKVLRDVSQYLKLQFIHVGIHEKLTFAKFLPPKSLTFAKLRKAAYQAEKNGAKFSFPLSSLEELKKPIFDPNTDPFSTTRRPKGRQDVVTASAVNYYAKGITEEEVKNFKGKYSHNSNLEKMDGNLAENVWRVGGLYSEALSEMIVHLEKAIPYASSENAKSIKTLIQFYKNGEEETFKKYNIEWLAYNKPVVDMIHGFIEEYRDPLGLRGSWEGNIFFISEVASGWLREVAEQADYYESKTPYHEQYKRKGVKPIANMVEVLLETGDAGPISWGGVNLPNDQSIRERYGSKNVLLWNARDAKESIIGQSVVQEFAPQEDRVLISKYSSQMAEILVGFHEALGHASGKNSDQVKGDPRTLLGSDFSWLEEERADLNALHHAWDPKTFSIRKDWNEEAAKALYKRYVSLFLLDLSELPSGATHIEEPHAVGRNLAINYFMKKWNVVEKVRRKENGRTKTYLIVKDENIPKMRLAVAELLAELQRIKSEADLAALKKIAQDYDATVVDVTLAKEVKARKRALNIPSYFALVFPEMRLVEEGNTIRDVELVYPTSLIRQQLAWSGYSTEQLKTLPAWLN